jgi:hypothetical protein
MISREEREEKIAYLEAARRKLGEAQFFFRRLVDQRDRPSGGEPGAFGYYLSALLSAGESVRYRLQKADKQKYDRCVGSLQDSTDSALLDFMNNQRGKEVHSAGAETQVEWEPISNFELFRKHAGTDHHPAYGLHIFSGLLGAQRPQALRPVVYFTDDKTGLVHNETDSVQKCERYLQLLERVLQAFSMDEA